MSSYKNFKFFVILIVLLAFSISFFVKIVNANEKNLTKIVDKQSKITTKQMYYTLLDRNDEFGANPISKKYAKKFVYTTIIEANKEGIRPDIAFALMMHETGFLNFTGDVSKEQNNFGGLGTTGGGVKGASFKDMKTGIRAVIQHLKCYASTEELNEKVVDPRWNDALRGKAIYVEHLGYKNNPNKKGWAYPGDGYGQKILNLIDEMAKTNPFLPAANILTEEEVLKGARFDKLFISFIIILSLLIIVSLTIFLIIFKNINNKGKKRKCKR